MAEIILTASLIITISVACVLLIRRLFDPSFIYLGINFYVLALSALAMSFGLTTEFESKFVLYKDHYLILQGLIIALFILGVILGFNVFKRSKHLAKIFPRIEQVPSESIYLTGLICLLLISVSIVLTAFLNAGGDIFSAIYQIRHGETIENFKFIQVSVRFFQLFTIAYLLDLMRRRRKGQHVGAVYPFIWLLLIISVLTGFMMGGKSFVVYPVLILTIGMFVCVYQSRVKAFILPVLLALMLLPALQFIRVAYVFDSSRAVENIIQDSLGMDLLDSNVLYLEASDRLDFTSPGEDFYYGLVGVIPRALWPEKPSQITVGGKFKDNISPGDAQGGWPVFGFNQWYVNFGWLGLIFGGALTGFVLRLLTNRYRDFQSNTYSLSFMVFLTILLISPGGVDNLILMRYILYVVPIFLFKFLMHSHFYLPSSLLKPKY